MKTYTLTMTEEQHKAFALVLSSFIGCVPTSGEAHSTRKKSCPHKNLHRRISPSFSGFRVSVQRHGFNFIRYFSLCKYETWDKAEQAAIDERDTLTAVLDDKNEAEVYQLFQEYRKHARRA